MKPSKINNLRFTILKQNKKLWISISTAVIITIITVSTLVYFSPYPPRQPKNIAIGDYSYAIDYTQYKVNKIMKTTKVPSVAVALIDDQEVIWQSVDGHANDETKTHATLSTIYRVGSITKVFTAIEIMRLFEDGLLDLDSPITDFIPDFSINSRFEDNTSITIRSLLQHHSGLPRNGNLPKWYWDAGVNVLRELTKSLKYSYTAYPVGYRYKYSNVGFDILGYIIEILRGDYFVPYMKENILRAIGMNDSTFLAQDIPLTRTLAVGHVREKRTNLLVNQYDVINLPSGNLYSTIPDMAEFTKFIFRGGFGLEDQLIENTTLQMMFDPLSTTKEDPKSIGLGWHTGLVNNKEKVVYHSGGIQGTHSLIAFLPERKLGIVLIGNSFEFEGAINQFGWQVLELMLEAKQGFELQDAQAKEIVSVSLAQIESYVGNYILDFELTDFFIKSNKLKANAMGTTFKLLPLSESKFKLKHWLIDFGNIEVEFYPGDEIINKFLIINYDDASLDFIPAYPSLDELPASWAKFLGTYDIYPRNESNYAELGPYGQLDLAFTDNILMLGSSYYLQPISDTEIILLSGPFVYETMIVDSLTGNIYWQNDIFKPIV